MELSQIVAELRQEYEELYLTEFSNGAVFIWRPLSPFEYKSIYRNEELTAPQKEEAFCQLCVLHVEIDGQIYHLMEYNFSEGLAGYATMLANELVGHSGFDPDGALAEQILDDYSSQMETFMEQAPCLIKMAFGDEVSFAEIEHWPLRKVLYYLSRAQWMLNTQATMLGLAITGRAPQEVVPLPRLRKDPKAPKVKPRSKEELEALKAHWDSMEWAETSEQEFLRLSPPDVQDEVMRE